MKTPNSSYVESVKTLSFCIYFHNSFWHSQTRLSVQIKKKQKQNKTHTHTHTLDYMMDMPSLYLHLNDESLFQRRFSCKTTLKNCDITCVQNKTIITLILCDKYEFEFVREQT